MISATRVNSREAGDDGAKLGDAGYHRDSEESLADCLLHKTHHHMTAQCWGAALEFMFPSGMDIDPNRFGAKIDGATSNRAGNTQKARDEYKAHYEKMCLQALILENDGDMDWRSHV